MIKIFTTNKNGKIELTKDELKNLLDDAYWEGFRNNTTTWVYNSPSWTPYSWTCSSSGATLHTNAVDFNVSNVTNDSITNDA